MSVSVVVKSSVPVVADAPYWDEEDKSLLYIDTSRNAIHRWKSTSKEDEAITLDEPLSFVIPSSSGGYIVGVGSKIAHLEWDIKEVIPLFDAAEDTPNMIFNEGKCDASGRLWAGTRCSKTIDNSGSGNLHCMRRSGRTIRKIENLETAAGVTWSNDNTIMYRSDPQRRKIYAFDFDFVYGETVLESKRAALDFTKNKSLEAGEPRGICSDSEGKIWVTFFGAGKVVRFDPITGERLREVYIPANNVMSCCFGGDNFDEMYVTTAVDGNSGDHESGSVYRVTNLGVTGEPTSSCLMDGAVSP